MYYIKNSAQAQDYSVRSERLLVPFAIVHNATPANKTYSSDLPADLALDLQGKLDADAIDSGCNFSTPTDSTGVFGLLLYGLGDVEKLMKYSIINLSSGTVTVAPAGASSSGVTASGNIAVTATWSGSLASTDLSAVFEVDYRIRQN